jgi:phospholipid/cholesterol/gamma-HCH transport system substrate-binding protein
VKPFRERNPLPIGIAGAVVIILLILAAFNASKLPFIGGGSSVEADFGNASGLQPGDDVRVAGVKVGKVKSVKLAGASVKVSMTVDKGMSLDNGTRADVKIKTLLGQMYVALTPGGTQPLKQTIPLSRTSTPMDVIQAFQGLGSTVGQIDTKQLATAFDTLAATFKDTPSYVHSSLTGLSRLSHSVASRNNALQALLHDANNVTTTLAARDAQVRKLIDDSSLILQTVSDQRRVIHKLLVDTTAVAKQLSGLVHDNRKLLGPALASLNGTLRILNANQNNLKQTLHLAAPFVRDFTDVVGNGRWFETVLWNLGPQLAPQACLTVGSRKVCPFGTSLGGSS